MRSTADLNAGFQQQLDAGPQLQANQNILNAGAKFGSALANFNLNSGRLNRIRESILNQKNIYASRNQDASLSDLDRNLALEKYMDLDMLDSSVNIGNVDEFGGLYDKIFGDGPGLTETALEQKKLDVGIQKAKIRADALIKATNTRASSAQKMQINKSKQKRAEKMAEEHGYFYTDPGSPDDINVDVVDRVFDYQNLLYGGE
jgi:hypothetical protein